MAQKILLLLGAGGNIGASAAALFKKNGYRVVSVARTVRAEVKAHSELVLTADFSDPSSVKGIFAQVEKKIGVPNVVIYNPFSWSMGPDPQNPLSPSLEAFQYDLAINTVSAYAAAQATVKGFERLGSDVKKTFIYTGNAGNTVILPSFHELGIGKTSSWYMIQTLVATSKFSSKGYRFYYVDERTPEGKAMHRISGPAHAEFFLELAEKDGQGKSLATFVRGKGYVSFKKNDAAFLPVVTEDKILDPMYGMPGTPAGNYGK